MKKIIFLFTFLVGVPCSAEFESRLTVAIAARLSYPATMIKLRNDVHDVLKKIKVSMVVDIQELYAEDLAYRARVATDLNKEKFQHIADHFDRKFEHINRIFILEAARLDKHYAPVKEKEQFILNLKRKAEDTIAALLRSYKKEFEIKP